MKKQITLVMLAAGAFCTLQSQVLSEDFNSPFSPAGAGWNVQNLSASANPTLAWFQGIGTIFPAFNGGPDDYYAVNFQNTTSQTPATISSWLISPTVNLSNGGIVQFATRTGTNPSSFADRLEVYISTAGNGTNVGSTPTSLGTFSILLGSVNPNLTTTGYPGSWTVYNLTITGLGSSTPGRIGFRYHVTNSGVNGSNGDFIGLDAVRYFAGCNVALQSYTICSGGSATLMATGAASNTTFTWTPGSQNTSSIVVSPSSTSSYTLNYTEPSGACPAQTSTITIGSNLSANITASNYNPCVGEVVTFTASSAAAQYSWSTGSTTHTTAVTVNTSTTISVGVASSNFACFGGNTITVLPKPSPVVSIGSPPSPFCTNGSSATITFSGQGASTYSWVSGSFTLINPTVDFLVTTPTPTAPINFTLAVTGFSNGCSGTSSATFVVAPQPTVTVSANVTTVCVNNLVSLSAVGGDSYQWSGASNSTASNITYTAQSTPGVVGFTVTGTSVAGCTHSAATSITVVACGGNTVTALGETIRIATGVYPNPFSNEIRVHALDGKIVIYNVLGEMILEKSVTGTAEINTSSFARGAYLVQAFNESGVLVATWRMVRN